MLEGFNSHSVVWRCMRGERKGILLVKPFTPIISKLSGTGKNWSNSEEVRRLNKRNEDIRIVIVLVVVVCCCFVVVVQCELREVTAESLPRTRHKLYLFKKSSR